MTTTAKIIQVLALSAVLAAQFQPSELRLPGVNRVLRTLDCAGATPMPKALPAINCVDIG